MTILSPQNTNLGLNGALHVCQLVQQKVRYMYVFAKPMTINCTFFGMISVWRLKNGFIKNRDQNMQQKLQLEKLR